MLDQLSLFDDPKEAPTWHQMPQTCPICGMTERAGFLLQSNHGFGEDGTIAGFPFREHPIYGEKCSKQYYRAGHYIRAVQTGEDTTKYEERCREAGLDPAAVLEEARDRYRTYDGVRIAPGNTVMVVKNWQPKRGAPHIVYVDMGDETPEQCFEDFAANRTGLETTTITRATTWYIVHHPDVSGPYQYVSWEIVP
ncbi:hypothetical protein ACFORJ_07920 [Corynebacterium hansenii]|uniref:Uncharacterized protein n=1 Tax=Corynebacterium hansenii TaxID=394964 RepID=A0ABV7ZPH8_9CORY|nr:hypothetical protein [Corynebacterium hansenii]WJZ00678.1 hypothetical protein CHAN_10385 [Corynebacterium hansenii]